MKSCVAAKDHGKRKRKGVETRIEAFEFSLLNGNCVGAAYDVNDKGISDAGGTIEFQYVEVVWQ